MVKKNILWLMGVGLILLIGGAIVWSRQSQSGQVSYPKNDETNVVVENKRFDGKSMSFEYKGNWTLRIRGNEPESMAVEVIDPKIGGDRYVVTLRMFNDALEEDSGIKMRKLYPDTYTEIKTNWLDGTGLVFKDKTKGEWVWFYLNNNKLITVSLLSSLNEDSKLADLQTIVESIGF